MWCGRCEPPQGPPPNHVVMVSVFRPPNWLSSPTSGAQAVLLDVLLRKQWAPKVIIHVNEEEATLADDLASIYEGSSIVLKAYSHFQRDFVDGGGFPAHAAAPKNGTEPKSMEAPPGKPLFSIMGDRLNMVPMGYYSGFLPDGMDGIEAARRALRSKALDRPLQWAFKGRKGGHQRFCTDRRYCMANSLSTWHPHWDDGDGEVPGSAIFSQYLESRFVASPRGSSLECFRHYESLVAGAVPLVDAGPHNLAWPWSSKAKRRMNSSSMGVETNKIRDISMTRATAFSPQALLPLPPAPLGWMFPDAALFDDDDVLLQRSSPSSDEWPNFCEDHTPWRSTLARARAMSDEEIDLRRELNARWYIAQVDNMRKGVQEALFSTPRECSDEH